MGVKVCTHSLSRNRWNSSSPTLTGEPPYYAPVSHQLPQIVPSSADRASWVDGCTYLRDQDPVAVLDAHRQPLAILVQAAGPDGENLGLVELLHTRLREEDAAGGLGLGLDALDKNPVQEGDESLDGSD